MGQTDRGCSVRACWFIVALAGFTIVLLHHFTRLFDTSSITLITSSLLFASASTILHIVRIHTLKHVRSGSFPHVKWMLVLTLLLTSTLNVVLVVLAAYNPEKALYMKLAMLISILHAAFVENITRIWSFIHSMPGWRSYRQALYLAISIQLLFFGGGSYPFLRRNHQLFWGLATLVL
ncbi:hypothetical protein FRB97_006891 [Tulasnella sp. 331]|nr:hypothetical protein FRB97_006891 [Tulasnella sp. 331]KAG8883894.1 hypothetical protein FRB98_002746 [Tulasnella sp. 332]